MPLRYPPASVFIAMITHAAVLWLRRVLWRPLWSCKSSGIAFGAPPVESVPCLHFSPAPCSGAQDAPGHAHAAFTRYVLDQWMVSACHECVRLGGRRSTDGRGRRSTGGRSRRSTGGIHACVGWRCQRASNSKARLAPENATVHGAHAVPLLFCCVSVAIASVLLFVVVDCSLLCCCPVLLPCCGCLKCLLLF